MKTVTCYEADDGSLHRTPEAAEAAEKAHCVRLLAAELANSVRPAYTNADEIAERIIENADIVLELADAIRARRPLEGK